MKINITILMILMFAISATSQTLQEKANSFNNKRAFHKKNYKVDYDKFNDKTRVHFSDVRVSESKESKSGAGGILLGVSFLFDGETLKSDIDEYHLIFQAVCGRWCFLDNHTLKFLADEQKVNLGDGIHNGKLGNTTVLRYNPGIQETMIYKVNRGDLTTIASSKSSEFQLGNYEAVLKEEHKQMLKNMLDLGLANKK